ncbi:uncharacterized protein LOC128813501 [Vidua macroura]|uniref:uncharacterized protein LOC128813501 n=1 Tax=Vidua macroura TaxID=187451 RepID=UPI0023A7FBA7|nr:uncharacterized protein LOC128813501 [Vidua macroura]
MAPRATVRDPEPAAAARKRGAERARGAGRGRRGGTWRPRAAGIRGCSRGSPGTRGAKRPREGGAAAGTALTLAARPGFSPAGIVPSPAARLGSSAAPGSRAVLAFTTIEKRQWKKTCQEIVNKPPAAILLGMQNLLFKAELVEATTLSRPCKATLKREQCDSATLPPPKQEIHDKIYTRVKISKNKSVLTLKTKDCQTWKISPDPLEEVEVSMEMHSLQAKFSLKAGKLSGDTVFSYEDQCS